MTYLSKYTHLFNLIIRTFLSESEKQGIHGLTSPVLIKCSDSFVFRFSVGIHDEQRLAALGPGLIATFFIISTEFLRTSLLHHERRRCDVAGLKWCGKRRHPTHMFSTISYVFFSSGCGNSSLQSEPISCHDSFMCPLHFWICFKTIHVLMETFLPTPTLLHFDLKPGYGTVAPRICWTDGEIWQKVLSRNSGGTAQNAAFMPYQP